MHYFPTTTTDPSEASQTEPERPRFISRKQEFYIRDLLQEAGKSWDEAAQWLSANHSIDLRDTVISRIPRSLSFPVIAKLRTFKQEAMASP